MSTTPISAGSVWAVNDVIDTECFEGYMDDGTPMGAMVRVVLVGGPNGVESPDVATTLVMSRDVAERLMAFLYHRHPGCVGES